MVSFFRELEGEVPVKVLDTDGLLLRMDGLYIGFSLVSVALSFNLISSSCNTFQAAWSRRAQVLQLLRTHVKPFHK